MAVEKNSRIIVTGQMRSGTTMLGSFLNSQKDITIYPDVMRVAVAAQNVLKVSVRGDQPLTIVEKAKIFEELIRLTANNGERPLNNIGLGLEWDLLQAMSASQQMVDFNDVAGLYSAMLDMLVLEAKINPNVMFGTKVTRSESIALTAADRGMKAIIILRDPRAVFVSQYLRAKKDPAFKVDKSVKAFVDTWREAFLEWERPSKALSIRYEDFLVDQTLGGKLPDYLGRQINANAMIGSANSSFGDSSTGKVRMNAMDRWREHGEAKHMYQIVESLAHEMIRAGYL